jgi:hypothetical protein
VTTTKQPPPLSDAEETKLDILLGIIRRGLDTTNEVLDTLEGIEAAKLELTLKTMEALAQIRNEGLYRPLTWEAFCQKQFRKTARWARYQGAYLKQLKQLIKEAEINGGTIGSALPVNERQARDARQNADKDTPSLHLADPANDTADEPADRLEGMDGPQILVGGEILGILSKGIEVVVRMLGKIDKKSQQRHPTFEEEQDMTKALARSYCAKVNLNVPAWAQEEPGPTGRRQTRKERRRGA